MIMSKDITLISNQKIIVQKIRTKNLHHSQRKNPYHQIL